MNPSQHADSLRAVLDSIFTGPSYRWVVHPDPWLGLKRWLNSAREWFNRFAAAHPVVERLIGDAILVLCAGMLLYGALRLVQALRHPRHDQHDATDNATHFRDPGWYHREADRLAAEQRYAEAIQADFLGLVLSLDARAVVQFHPSKTPAEYAREAALSGNESQAFRGLVARLYRYAFARIPCGADDFAAWRRDAQPERYAAAH